MAEHVHKYKLDLAKSGYYCGVEGCNMTLLLEEAIPRINAAERLSVEMRDGADEYDKACVVAVAQGLMTGNVELTKALQTMINYTGRIVQAYANIREGK